MDAKILQFTGMTILDIDVDEVLEQNKGLLDDVVLTGWDKEGNFYMAASSSDKAKLLMLLALGQKFLLEME